MFISHLKTDTCAGKYTVNLFKEAWNQTIRDKSLSKKGLSIWSSDVDKAESIFIEAYWKVLELESFHMTNRVSAD